MDKTSAQQAGRGLTRPRQPMPAAVRAALEQAGLVDTYRNRPPYQRNDYLMWINKAKLDATRRKRLTQMLDELKAGDVYMGMAWRAASRGRH
ncbi:YdeI/OmpD-associated family protein [Reyranella sp. CPCC 100927]|uniref:YdeI/OmpD-associated family protein n=1 Tax=Reyranella sp. CPCC 100927 TaxID=2599616 RepID=UPI002107AAAE|nr:YdeI/OmpD-associated family protein [Reyranella sp. CPCC 100927]